MFSRPRTLARLAACALVTLSAIASPAGIDDLTRMSEQLNQLDKADFQASVRAGVDCASSRNFDCAERQFFKAGKSAVDAKDKRTLADARNLLQRYRDQARREEQARLREEEARLREEQARREEEEERVAKREKYEARVEACDSACAHSGQRHLCKTYTIGPSQCNRDADDDRPSNYAGAMQQGLNNSLAGLAQIQRSQNQALANVQAAIAARQREDQAQRDNQRAQQQRAEQRERAQADDRAEQRERAQRAERAERVAQTNVRDQEREQRERAQQRAAQAAQERAAAATSQQRQSTVVASNDSPKPQSGASPGFPRTQEQQQQIAIAQQTSSSRTQSVANSGYADNNTAPKVKKPSMGQDNGPCISYGATIPVGKSVCYAESMEQWRCEGWQGESVFRKVQKIIMKSEIKVDNICFHVDRANLRPARDSQME